MKILICSIVVAAILTLAVAASAQSQFPPPPGTYRDRGPPPPDYDDEDDDDRDRNNRYQRRYDTAPNDPRYDNRRDARPYDPRYDDRDPRNRRDPRDNRDPRSRESRPGPAAPAPVVAPVLSVSPTAVARGGSATISWNGGSAATTCAVYLSDATRRNYQPWAASVSASHAVSGITSNMIFSMTCIGAGGAYLPGPTPTATVTVQ